MTPDTIRTYVSADATPDLRERVGFIDVCCYGIKGSALAWTDVRPAAHSSSP